MPAGRPPLFENPEDLQKKTDEYFLTGIKKRTIVIGPPNNRQSVEVEIPTITGLCIYLGFESRQSFYDLEKQDKFSYIIKRARLFIENEYEELLQTGNVTGAIFALKNMGWYDKTEIDHSNKGEKFESNGFDLSKIPSEVLLALINSQKKE